MAEKSEDDKRLNDILEMIGRIAALDFSKPLEVGRGHDMIDAIALGLNMLSEELSTNVVEKSKIDSVNRKLEKFAFTTAHDLRSPLNSITGLITLLELNLDRKNSKEVFEYVDKIKNITDQMKNLVQGILDYSLASSELEREPLDIRSIVNDVMEVDQLTSLATVHFECELPSVMFNRSIMHQVIRNLLGNAVKYSDKEVCNIVIRCEENQAHIVFSISDNGPGIPKEYHKKIFQLFNKIDTAAKVDSHGIGLATVKSVLEASGERIWVESEMGKGSTFYFTISTPCV